MKQIITESLFQITKPKDEAFHVATSCGVGFYGGDRASLSLTGAGMSGVILKDGDKIAFTLTIRQDTAIGTVEVERKEP